LIFKAEGLFSLLLQLLMQIGEVLVAFMGLDANGVLDSIPPLIDLRESVFNYVVVFLEGLHIPISKI
jgi:hypothetical protein